VKKPCSLDLPERAMVRLAGGESAQVVAAALNIAVSSVINWGGQRVTFWQRRSGTHGRSPPLRHQRRAPPLREQYRRLAWPSLRGPPLTQWALKTWITV
jgi:hypothetical protein